MTTLLGGLLPATPLFAQSATPVDLLDAVNAVRIANDLLPLAPDERLVRLSQDYAGTMAQGDCLAHDCGQLGRVGNRAAQAGVGYRLIGEALAGGPPEATRVVELWMTSDNHRALLLNPEVTTAGVGHVYRADDDGRADYGHYWVLTISLQD